ncbi:hypothetical protein VP01_2704g3 [Puccinia sorghi]|uniref:Helicase ATP-binding domain-containing protein n=1 Tax=Puccinia sorghi TaxID=27349 RepID=A0A0L6V3L6_9BASI|nr:hypothetical protein VP01_2704g3 [Puccinia sorghi]
MLKPYQFYGVKFFFQHYQQKNSVVLGDDMDLTDSRYQDSTLLLPEKLLLLKHSPDSMSEHLIFVRMNVRRALTDPQEVYNHIDKCRDNAYASESTGEGVLVRVMAVEEPGAGEQDGYLIPHVGLPVKFVGRYTEGELIWSILVNYLMLKPYQCDGVKFFFQHYQQKNGVVLGDNMGLGKTIQVIAFLLAVMGKKFADFEQNSRKKAINKLPKGQSYRPSKLGPTCLMIFPNSEINNWAREIDSYTTLTSKTIAAETLSRFNVGAFDILICRFNYARDHIDNFYDLYLTIVGVDEAHKLKNRKSATACAFPRFKTEIFFGSMVLMNNFIVAIRHILMCILVHFLWGQGTAMQNNIFNVGCLCRESTPAGMQIRCILQKGIAKGPSFGTKVLARPPAKKVFSSLLILTKSEILHELPPRTNHVALCPMTAMQKLAHASLLSDPDIVNMRKNALPCSCGKKNYQGSAALHLFLKATFCADRCCDKGWQKRTFPYLILFGKIVNHLALAFPSELFHIGDSRRFFFKSRINQKNVNKTKFTLRKCFLMILVLKPLLEQWNQSQFEVLLFLQSTKMMDIIEYWLQQDFPESCGNSRAIKQSRRVSDRSKQVYLFGKCQGCRHHCGTPVKTLKPWTGARIGQQHAVDCIHLILSGTTEELVHHRQIYKQRLSEVANTGKATSQHFTGVQGDKNNQGKVFG